MLEREGRLPDTIIAAIGGGSNAMGLFYPFLDDTSVRIIGVEAGGKGVDDRMEHCASPDRRAARRAARQPDLSPAGRGRADPRRPLDLGRARLSRASARSTPGCTTSAGPNTSAITDAEALEAFQLCCELEGIIPALEPAHALAHVMKIAPDAAEGPPDRDEHVRPGRQGHLHRGPRPWLGHEGLSRKLPGIGPPFGGPARPKRRPSFRPISSKGALNPVYGACPPVYGPTAKPVGNGPSPHPAALSGTQGAPDAPDMQKDR